MAEHFADRLVPDTYRDDEPWAVALVQTGRPVDWGSALPDEEAYIPERIAERLLALGGMVCTISQRWTVDGKTDSTPTKLRALSMRCSSCCA
jgi:hypothetical protein